jgi:hypothetical protein
MSAMKITETCGLRRAGAGVLLALALGAGAAFAGNAPTFKPGTYTGTLQLVNTIDAKVFNKSTLKVRGHTTSDTRIIFLAPPQLAMPILGQTADDHPVRFFAIEFSIADGAMVLAEWQNVDAGTGTSSVELFSSLVVKPASVTAEINLPSRTVGSLNGSHAVSQTLIIKLVRTGP